MKRIKTHTKSLFSLAAFLRVEYHKASLIALADRSYEIFNNWRLRGIQGWRPVQIFPRFFSDLAISPSQYSPYYSKPYMSWSNHLSFFYRVKFSLFNMYSYSSHSKPVGILVDLLRNISIFANADSTLASIF